MGVKCLVRLMVSLFSLFLAGEWTRTADKQDRLL